LHGKKIPILLHLTKWLNQVDKPATLEKNAEAKILAAARNVFINKGYAGARMQEIADEAGINKALLHYYFRSKDKLFEQIFREAFGKLLPSIAEIFTRPISIFEKFEQFTEAYISVVIENPFIPVFVLSEMHRNPDEFFGTYIQPEMAGNVQIIGQEIAKAVQAGTIRPIDPRQLMMNLMSLCVFPFVARPMFQKMMQISDADFEKMLMLRKKEVSQFIILAIQPIK
jgi:TetR/AcrR family transcriptional regulator